MKKLYFLIIAGSILTASNSFAQNNNTDDGFSQLIRSSPADATKLISAYGGPLFKGFGIGLNSGWNNTAKTKKLLHFDLRLTFNGAFVPQSDKTFDLTKIGLSNHVAPANASQTIAPTIGGASTDGPDVNIKDDNGNVVSTFKMPKGQTSIIPAPNIQLTVGLFKNTDLTIRTTPKVSLGNDVGSVSMIGFGIKHNIIQDFAKTVPKPFDLAIAVGYNRINLTKTLDVKPESGALPINASQSSDFSNQRVEAHFSGVTVQGILSKKLAFFTPFVAVAYNTAKTELGAYGNFPVTSNAVAGQKFYTTFKDPIYISETSVSGMRADIGFQMNLGFFRVYASGSTGKYASVNGGIGFGF